MLVDIPEKPFDAAQLRNLFKEVKAEVYGEENIQCALDHKTIELASTMLRVGIDKLRQYYSIGK